MIKTWNEGYELAKKYYEYHGDLRVKVSFKTNDGITYDEDGFALGKWVNRQRFQYSSGQLTMEHRQKLEIIGMVFENINELEWNCFYEQAIMYLYKHNSLNIPKNFRTINGYARDEKGKNLGAWWSMQRYNYNNNNTLSKERAKKIEYLYFCLSKIEETEWNKMYELAKKYYDEYNTLIIKKGYSLVDDEGKLMDLSQLKEWVLEQRKDYKLKKLSTEKIEKLEAIGMIFDNVTQVEWDRMYALAIIYSKAHGNLRVPRKFKTKNGAEYDRQGSALGKWINAQYSYNCNGSLSQEHKQKLEAIGMMFTNQIEKNWQEMLKLVSIYSKTYGDFDIPQNFKTKDGITYDADGKDIGIWLSRQKANGLAKTLTDEHRKELEAIGFVFENFNLKEWNKMYELAKIYYEKYKNLDVPVDFKTKDGITYDADGNDLYIWINKQPFLYNTRTISKEKKIKLEQLGMTIKNRHNDNWNKMYELAKIYYLEYRDLRINSGFKTKDGITYDENGENLGAWIATQRSYFKKGILSKVKIKKLQLIGMVFNVSKNKHENARICLAYDIDYKEYKKEIDSIPSREFRAKVNYLNDNGIPFIVMNQLHPIFFVSSINMEVEYGLSLEQMILNYERQLESSKQITKTIKVGV